MDDRKTWRLCRGPCTRTPHGDGAGRGGAGAPAASGREGGGVRHPVAPEEVLAAARRPTAAPRRPAPFAARSLPVSIKDLFDIRGQQRRRQQGAGRHAARHARCADRAPPEGPAPSSSPHQHERSSPIPSASIRITARRSIRSTGRRGAFPAVPPRARRCRSRTAWRRADRHDTGGSCRIPARSAASSATSPRPVACRSMARCPFLDARFDRSAGAQRRLLRPARPIISGDRPPFAEPPSVKGLRWRCPKTLVRRARTLPSPALRSSAEELARISALVEEIELPEFAELRRHQRQGWLPGLGSLALAPGAYRARVGPLRPARRQPHPTRRAMTASDYIDLLQARRALDPAVERRIRRYDALVMPTVPLVLPASPILRTRRSTARQLLMLRNPTLINFLDGCAISLPCQAPGDAPVGLTLAARRGKTAISSRWPKQSSGGGKALTPSPAIRPCRSPARISHGLRSNTRSTQPSRNISGFACSIALSAPSESGLPGRS